MQPEQTISYRVYKDGSVLTGVATVEHPQIQYITKTIAGSGIAGEYEAPSLGMTGSMTIKLTWLSKTKDYFRMLDMSTGSMLELRASIQQYDETTGLRKTVPERITLVATPKTASLGSHETGKTQGNEMELDVTRIRIELDGEEKLLIDKLAFIHRINGKDTLSNVREHLGLDY